MMAYICTSFVFEIRSKMADLWLFFSVKCVPNHFSAMHGLILFKLGTSTVPDGIYVHLTLFCEMIKDGRLVDWQPF